MSESDVSVAIEPGKPFWLVFKEEDPKLTGFYKQMAEQDAEYTMEYDHEKMAYKVVVKTPGVVYDHPAGRVRFEE